MQLRKSRWVRPGGTICCPELGARHCGRLGGRDADPGRGTSPESDRPHRRCEETGRWSAFSVKSLGGKNRGPLVASRPWGA